MTTVESLLNGRTVEDILHDPVISGIAQELEKDNLTLDGFYLPQEYRDEFAEYSKHDLKQQVVDRLVEISLREGSPMAVTAARAANSARTVALETINAVQSELAQTA